MKLKLISISLLSIILLKYKDLRNQTSNIEEQVNEKDNSNALETLKNSFPELASVLVDERDYYMAKNIQDIREKYDDFKIVAVVGAGHIDGIKGYLEKPETMPDNINEIGG